MQYDSHTEVSDEDFIYDRFNFLNAFYNLDVANSWSMLAFSTWPRDTMDILLGNTIGERSELKQHFLTKTAIQGYPKTLVSLSYYYKGEERDIVRAQLWRKYAIKMGASKHPSNWSNYPPILEDEMPRRVMPTVE